MSVYIATHKKFKLPELDAEYIPLQVGAACKEYIGYLTDDSGENISGKNSNYCELTGLYWIWKNDKESKIKGLVHYRRYFTKYRISSSDKGFLCKKDIEEILTDHDIILSSKEYFKETAWEEYYMVCGLEKDLRRVEKIIEDKYPDYLDAFYEYFKGNTSHLFNMMICRRELFDEYCEWLFGILFELEQQVRLEEYNDYQKRIFGFMSERLLNVWVKHKKLQVYEARTVNTELSMVEKLRIFIRRFKNMIVFSLK